MLPEITAAAPASSCPQSAMVAQAASVLRTCTGDQDPGGFLSQGWANLGTRNLPGSPPLQLATLTNTGSQGLEGRLMEKAAGNLLCNKTVHKRQCRLKPPLLWEIAFYVPV